MRLLTITILLFISSAIFAQNFEWTQQTSGVSTALNDVYFGDKYHGCAVGDNGVILYTTNGGQTWNSPTVSVTTEKLRALSFADLNTGWAVGGVNSGVILRTDNGGSTWEDISPSSFGYYQILDVAFANLNVGWVITFDSIYMTTNGGTTWAGETYLSSLQNLSNRAITVTSDTTAYVAGKNKRGVPFSAYADVLNRSAYGNSDTWGGSAASNFENDDNLYSIEFSSSNVGFAGGQNGIIYKLEQVDTDLFNGPWNVNLDLNPTGLQTIKSISFPSESRGMFLTSTEVSGVTFALFYHTSDTGDTWSATPDSLQDLFANALMSPDTLNAWVVGNDGKIYKGTPWPTSINTLSAEIDIAIYPNPSSDIIKVEINSKNNKQIRYSLLDMAGRIIEQGNWNLNSSNSSFILNISDYNNGVYLLQLNTDKRQSSFRVLKN